MPADNLLVTVVLVHGAFVDGSGWRQVHDQLVLATQDRMIPPVAQAQMARRAGMTVVEVDASHAVMVWQPAAVVRVIESAARAAHGKTL